MYLTIYKFLLQNVYYKNDFVKIKIIMVDNTICAKYRTRKIDIPY